MGGISRYSGGVSVEGACKHCFSLIMYEFCSSNAPYSASLSFIMFIEYLGVGKKIKWGDGHIGGCGVVHRRGASNLLHTMVSQ